MKKAKSNTNVLKKLNGGKNKKTNIFKKPSAHQNSNYIKSNYQTGRKNYLISLLDKNTLTHYDSNKFNFNHKKNSIKEIYLTSAIENKNSIEDLNKNKYRHGNINIRLNLNSEIINNNFNNYYNYNHSTKKKIFHKSKSNTSINEKIKEKDKLITKLQKELLQSQEFLNQLQKDKQNELIFTYNTIKKIDKLDKNFNRSLTALLNTPSLLKFNHNNNKANINKKDFNVFNSGFYSTNNRKYKITSSSPKSNYIRCFSSSPNRFFSYNLDSLETYNSNILKKKTFNKISNKNIGFIHNSKTNIFMNQNDEIAPNEEIYFSRQISYSNCNTKNINNNSDFIDKCQKLKKRANLLLNNYMILIKEQNLKSKNKKK